MPQESKKPRRKKPGLLNIDSSWKSRYQEAHEQNFKTEYPNAYKDGHYFPPKFPDVATANGLQKMVVDHLTWTGQYGNRINVMGRKIGGLTKTASGAVFDDSKWIKASTKKGTADVDTIMFGLPVKLEIKIGRDTIKPDQLKEKARIERAGGVYAIIKIPQDYFTIYDQIQQRRQGLFQS